MTSGAVESSPYSALSYTWGTSARSHVLECDNGVLPITQNLHNALRRLRHATETRTFWVDAVCINQADILERNAQIGLMKEIFGIAQEVIIWIGEDNQNTVDGVNLLKLLYAAALEGKLPAFSDFFLLEEKLEQAGLPKYDSPAWKCAVDLYQRSWFTRIWVVQELALAKSAVVHCGRQSVPWSYFSYSAPCILKAVIWNYLNLQLRFEYNRFIGMDWSRDRLQQGLQTTLLDCLSRARSSFSMDPRDKVFGILGLASDDKTLLPNPDYSTSVVEIYQTLTKNTIITQRSLDILSEVEDPMWTLIDKLPSWAVDWSAQTRGFPFRKLPVYTHFRAAGDSVVRLDKCTTPGTLALTGNRIDTIHRCGLPLLRLRPRDSPLLKAVNLIGAITLRTVSVRCIAQCRWQQWERLALTLNSYPHHPSASAAYLRTLIAGAPMPDSPHDLTFLYQAYLRASGFLRGSMALACSAEPNDDGVCTHWRAYADNVEAVCHGRRFFVTRKGYMGLAPVSAREGDVVCILRGGKTPYVVRAERKRGYRFVGECYVEGLMGGGGMGGGEEEGCEEFVLL